MESLFFIDYDNCYDHGRINENPFDENIGNWDVSSVKTMKGMFWILEGCIYSF